MEYSESFICRSYRTAKDKKNQITILKELNNCKYKEIVNILLKNNEIKQVQTEGSHSILIDVKTNEILTVNNKINNYKNKTRNVKLYKQWCNGKNVQCLSSENELSITRIRQILRKEAEIDNKDYSLLVEMRKKSECAV